MAEKKYILTNENIVINGHKLYRIKAIKSFNDVNIGELGGFIEKEDNLSQKGDCWVGNNAKVYNNAKIYDNAQVLNGMDICDNTIIRDNVLVSGYGRLCGNTIVCENVRIIGCIFIDGDVQILGNTYIMGNVCIMGNAIIKSHLDFISFSDRLNGYEWFTYTKSNNMWSGINFHGTSDELLKKAHNKSTVKKYKNMIRYVENILNKNHCN